MAQGDWGAKHGENDFFSTGPYNKVRRKFELSTVVTALYSIFFLFSMAVVPFFFFFHEQRYRRRALVRWTMGTAQ
jgi:hypothetical protein